MKKSNYCSVYGKRRFHTEGKAMDALKWIRRRPRDEVPKRSYYCYWCDGWHLTKEKVREGVLVKNWGLFLRFLNGD